MTSKQKIRRQCMEMLERKQHKAEEDAHSRRDEICKMSPEFAKLESEKRENNSVLLGLLMSGSSPEQISKLKEKFNSTEKKQEEILLGLNLPGDYLLPHYDCRICNDRGITDNGRECVCFRKLFNRMYYAALCREFPLEEHSFENFSLEYYDESADRVKMKANVDACIGFAKSFPNNGRNLLLCGATGLGKTHLSLAIANEVISRGNSVLYNSAQNFLSTIQQESFGRSNGNTIEDILSCDLLILDDLGVEFLNQFSLSAVYNIINTRSINKRSTVINTNLSIEELETRYGQRIFSRLIGCYDWIMFVGKDIRIQKKFKKK